jgi:hypothetical protein
MLAAPVAERVLLDAAADLVEGLGGDAHDVERIGDLNRVGKHAGERPR